MTDYNKAPHHSPFIADCGFRCLSPSPSHTPLTLCKSSDSSCYSTPSTQVEPAKLFLDPKKSQRPRCQHACDWHCKPQQTLHRPLLPSGQCGEVLLKPPPQVQATCLKEPFKIPTGSARRLPLQSLLLKVFVYIYLCVSYVCMSPLTYGGQEGRWFSPSIVCVQVGRAGSKNLDLLSHQQPKSSYL